jgi:hypothetical protein
MNNLLTLLPAPLRPYAKAIAPAVLAVLAALVHVATSGGQVAGPELGVAITGLLAALVTFLVPNADRPATVPLLPEEDAAALAAARASAAAEHPPTTPGA